ncbi:MAG: hypothetical protein QOC81_313 [Thermoanaerobaculia bacterium]|jgi:hypothetical protein|nr:hypothetical protein [Thermoanaerobaculia bacterium]
MSDVLAAASLPPRRRIFVRSVRDAARRRRRQAIAFCLFVAIASVAALLLLKGDDRLLAAPMLAIVVTSSVYMMVMWARDGSPPVFEAGTLCMLAITVYGTLPMVGFLMMRGEWDQFVDGRMHAYSFNAAELGMFGWRYVVYAVSFAVSYLVMRGRKAVKTTVFALPSPATQAAVAVMFIALYIFKIALRIVYDYDPEDYSYADPMSAAHSGRDMPYLMQQISHNSLSALFVVQLGVIVLLLSHWRKRWCRYALVMWLGSEVVISAIRLGSRGKVVLLLISAGVLYHRLVKRVSFRTLVVSGSLLLAAFMVAGAIRNTRSGDMRKEQAQHILTAANEFQGLFTTAYDIKKRRESGDITSIPWQVYVSDFYFPIPSQFLPFEKIDPSSWYIDAIGQTGAGVGYMFGVMSQAAVGLDWIELVLRGVALAMCLALLHRWYVRHSSYFWPTLLYLFISIWAYYTFRASTFYFVYFVVYHFLPVVVATKLLEQVLSRVGRKTAEGPSAVVRA